MPKWACTRQPAEAEAPPRHSKPATSLPPPRETEGRPPRAGGGGTTPPPKAGGGHASSRRRWRQGTNARPRPRLRRRTAPSLRRANDAGDSCRSVAVRSGQGGLLEAPDGPAAATATAASSGVCPRPVQRAVQQVVEVEERLARVVHGVLAEFAAAEAGQGLPQLRGGHHQRLRRGRAGPRGGGGGRSGGGRGSGAAALGSEGLHTGKGGTPTSDWLNRGRRSSDFGDLSAQASPAQRILPPPPHPEDALQRAQDAGRADVAVRLDGQQAVAEAAQVPQGLGGRQVGA